MDSKLWKSLAVFSLNTALCQNLWLEVEPSDDIFHTAMLNALELLGYINIHIDEKQVGGGGLAFFYVSRVWGEQQYTAHAK